MELVKLTVSVRPAIQETLNKQAEARGLTITELIRAVVLPEWIAHAKPVQEVRIDA